MLTTPLSPSRTAGLSSHHSLLTGQNFHLHCTGIVTFLSHILCCHLSIYIPRVYQASIDQITGWFGSPVRGPSQHLTECVCILGWHLCQTFTHWFGRSTTFRNSVCLFTIILIIASMILLPQLLPSFCLYAGVCMCVLNCFSHILNSFMTTCIFPLNSKSRAEGVSLSRFLTRRLHEIK